MTRDQLVDKFRIVIDEVGTSEFENVDTFLNASILALFNLMLDPKALGHPDAKGFERDVYTSEYLRDCKFKLSGTALAAGVITRAELEALKPGRRLSRISSVRIKTSPTGTLRPCRILTSSMAAVAHDTRFYAPSSCNPFIEPMGGDYLVFPSASPVGYELVAIMEPREISSAQQVVDLPDALWPAIVYHATTLAGASIRDTEFVEANAGLIKMFGL